MAHGTDQASIEQAKLANKQAKGKKSKSSRSRLPTNGTMGSQRELSEAHAVCGLQEELAWTPRQLEVGSSQRHELLLGFVLYGLYSNETTCAAVARAVCFEDPVTAERLMLSLVAVDSTKKVQVNRSVTMPAESLREIRSKSHSRNFSSTFKEIMSPSDAYSGLGMPASLQKRFAVIEQE